MRYLFAIYLLLLTMNLRADDVDCQPDCGSQLLRVDVAKSALSDESVKSILPALKSVAQSEQLKDAIENASFEVKSVDFPYSKVKCKANLGLPGFEKIKTCEEKDICSNKEKYGQKVQDRLCLNLPCDIFEGDFNQGACGQGANKVKDIHFTKLAFPGKFVLGRPNFVPTSSDYDKTTGETKLCFDVKDFSVNLNVQLTMNTLFPPLTLRNINPKIGGPGDEPRKMCVTAKIGANGKPVSDLKITGDPLLSDQMILNTVGAVKIDALPSFDMEKLETSKGEILTVIAHSLKDSLNEEVNLILEKELSEQIERTVNPFLTGGSVTVDGKSLMNKMSLPNVKALESVAKIECSMFLGAGDPIPAHCKDVKGFPASALDNINRVYSEISALEILLRQSTVVDEDIINRLAALLGKNPSEVLDSTSTFSCPADAEVKPVVCRLKTDIKKDDNPRISEERKKQSHDFFEGIQKRNIAEFPNRLRKLASAVKAKQDSLSMGNVVQIVNNINDGKLGSSFGLTFPELCDPKPSAHADKKMAGCPVQVYADIEEFGKVLARMWETGQLCESGSGKYVPNSSGGAKSGCYINMNGMSCYIDAAPKIKYVPKIVGKGKKARDLGKYELTLPLKACYKSALFGLLYKFGVSMPDLKMSFRPKECNGDLCLTDVQGNPGTLTEKKDDLTGGWKATKIEDGIMSSIMKELPKYVMENIKLPLASTLGFPVQTKKVDTGVGYLGVCLEPKKTETGTQQ
ncbi:MAG TPA: hypothetical protein VNJ01_13345 [Bacteriovoracaceae bacterium]|nr:hypothetical protein [Bacteriovoracaceae bacterium]